MLYQVGSEILFIGKGVLVGISCLSFGPVYSAYVTIGLLLVLVLGHISV